MTQITRRTILCGLAATAAPLPAVSAALLPQSPQERLQAAVEELKAAAAQVYPGITRWEVCIGDEFAHCPVLIASFSKGPTPTLQTVEYSGPGFYKVAGIRPDGGPWECTLWLERVDYKTVPGFYYRAESWWKGRLEYARRLKPATIRIVSRDDEYAAIHRA